MPTFKHPCPYCEKFIDRAVAACPFCGQLDPFAPRRCPNCRKIVEDPAWVICPTCGQSLGGPVIVNAAPDAAAPGSTASPAATGSGAAQPVAAPRPPLAPGGAAPVQQSAGACSGCGAPLPGGARFCTICGTVAG
jgi:RNA polymerase subunit RPABC4/transcription elongation factor Spt4